MSKSMVADVKQSGTSAVAVSNAVTAVEQQRVELAALRQRARTTMQQTELHQEIEAAKAKLDQFHQKAFHKLDEWEQHLDADVARLDAKVNDATERTRTAIEQDVAEAREERDQFRTQVKASFTARLNDLKADVESLQAKAATSRNEAKSKLDAHIAELHAQQEAEQQRLGQLDEVQGEAWNVMNKRIRKAITSYQNAVRKAETEYAKGK